MGHKFITEPGSERDLFDVDLRAIVLKRPWRALADWDHQATREFFGTERPGSCRPDKAPQRRSDGRTFDEIARRSGEATGARSTRSPRNVTRRPLESPVADARSQPSKARSGPGIPICRGCASRWPTGRRNYGYCKPPEDWPPVAHVWRTCVRAAAA